MSEESFKTCQRAAEEIFHEPVAGRGEAVGDLDNDGFQGIVSTCLDGEARTCTTGKTVITGS